MWQSVCGVCVGVGSFADPGDVPGLAHLLEHSTSHDSRLCVAMYCSYVCSGLHGK